MPAETPSRSRIPAPLSSRIPAPTSSRIPAPLASKVPPTPSRLAPPGQTRTVTLRAQKSASSLRPPAPNDAPRRKSPSPSPTTPRFRAKTPTSTKPKPAPLDPPSPGLERTMGKLSMKDQIAQRRAMMRDQVTRSTAARSPDEEWGDGKGISGKSEEDDLLGRSSMIVDITRARTTGKLDLSFRELRCLPYTFFNLHLGLEPSFPPPPPKDPTEKEVKQPSFYECVDLISLRARDNQIEEVQDEISYFVGLKVLDLNRNKLSKLPSTFSELHNLANLDLAHNLFTSIPPELASLTALTSLDISNNPLASLENLPGKLGSLSASYCQLTLSSLKDLPAGLVQLDISHNGLGPTPLLSAILEPLSQLKSLTAKSCDLDAADFLGDGWWTTRLSTLELGGPQKEDWEIEIERRSMRRRQPTASSTSQGSGSTNDVERKSPSEDAEVVDSPSAGPDAQAESHILDNFYNASTLTLTLPSSRTRPSPPAHIPTNTLPYDVILRHSWTGDLKCLVLNGRNTSTSFTLPDVAGMLLHRVEELEMVDCGLTETTRMQVDGIEHEENTFSSIARLFPSLRTAELSYNRFPSLAGIRDLVARNNAERTGVRELKLKGCGVHTLDELVTILEDGSVGAELDGTGLALKELDLSDNDIAKLPPKLGLLPVDILLVDGNLFRVPARRVWEKEGTKGLLAWLRERM